MEEERPSILALQRRCVEGMLQSCGGFGDGEEEDESDVVDIYSSDPYGRDGSRSSARGGGGKHGHASERWKVLVYDFKGRDILALLFKVSELRAMGVTLHLLLDSARQPIPDVPAVYFCTPTEKNVKRIALDCASNLYEACHVNFTSSIPRPVLESFAQDAATMPRSSASSIRRLFDGYSNFLSLEDDLFSLDLRETYSNLLNTLKDSEVEELVEQIVTGLFSVIATMGQVPIIRAQRGGPAEMVATKLDARIRDGLSMRNNVFAEANAGLGLGVAPPRQLLIILDRSIDLPVMLHHTWSYQALTHDLLEMRLNRVNINVKESNESFTSGQRTFDLDKSDPFWRENAGFPFPKVAEAVQKALEEYKSEVADINRRAGSVGEVAAAAENPAALTTDSTDKLAQALQNLPELTKRKQRIDLHTNLATALLDKIKDRNLDAFFSAEDHLMGGNSSTDTDTITRLLRDSTGTADDKMRLFLIYFLCIRENNAEMAQFERLLEAAGCDLRALKYVKKIKTFTSQVDLSSTLQSMSTPAATQPSATDIGLSKMMSSLVEHGSKGLTQVANNFNKLILDEDTALETARVVDTLMEWKAGREDITEQYAYFDAKQPKNNVNRSRKPVRQAVVFMVGGGNYVEYQNIKDHLRNNRHVIYGSTDIPNGEDFLKQMEALSGEAKREPAPDKV